MIGLRAALRPLLLLAGMLAAGLLVRLLPAGGVAGLLAPASGPDGGGLIRVATLVAAGAALCAAGLPRQVVCYAFGFAFGGWLGAGLSLLAQVAGCAIDFAWARALGRDWVARRMRGRLARLDAALSRRPFAATLSLRLLPVGNNLLLNLAAGISSVAALPFLAGSAVGYLPQTLVFALAGSGVRLAHGAQLALAAILFAGSALLGMFMLRRGAAAPEAMALNSGGAPAARGAIPRR